MSQTIIRFRPAAAQPRWQDRVSRAWQRLAAARADAVTRRRLAALDDRELKDIGLSRAQAQFEAERPIWELVPFFHR